MLLSLLFFIFFSGGIVFYFISLALSGYGVGLIFGSIPHIVKGNLNQDDAAEAYGLNQISRSMGYSIGSVISINIISSLFLNSVGEASKYSYIMLGIVGLIITVILSSLIMYGYKWKH